MVSVDDLKGVLYLDGNDEDGLLSAYLTAADQFVKNAVGASEDFYVQPNVEPLVDLATKSLAATYYQNRLALSDTQTYAVDFTVNSVIGQLRGMHNHYEEGDHHADANKPTQPSN